MSDWTTDPAEIPPDGSRHDMTLSKVGFATNHTPSSDNPTKLVLRCVIDNGEYEGFRLSTSFHVEAEQGALNNFLQMTGLTYEVPLGGFNRESELITFVRWLRDREKEHRFSAMVTVQEVQKENERIATYALGNYSTPENEASLRLRTEPTQFHRD